MALSQISWATSHTNVKFSATDEEIISAIDQQLQILWSQQDHFTEQEKLSHALSYMAKDPKLMQGVQITAEVLNWYKTGRLPLSPEDKQTIYQRAKIQFREHLDLLLQNRRFTHSQNSLMRPISKELIKGAVATGISLFSIWAASSGFKLQYDDWVLALRSFSLIATMYALYRPFKILKLVTQHGEIDQLRIEQKEHDKKHGPVPEPLWQSWFLLRQLAELKNKNFSCLEILKTAS